MKTEDVRKMGETGWRRISQTVMGCMLAAAVVTVLIVASHHDKHCADAVIVEEAVTRESIDVIGKMEEKSRAFLHSQEARSPPSDAISSVGEASALRHATAVLVCLFSI
jgi:hypothetical protein